jgi:hypothetical protein
MAGCLTLTWLMAMAGWLSIDDDHQPLAISHFQGFVTGFPSLTHWFHPPRSARMVVTPRSLSMSTARALVASSCHAQ